LLARITAHPAGVGEERAVVDADARLVRLELPGLEEAHVVGGHHQRAAPGGERHRAGDVGLLEGLAEALQLEMEAPGEERLPRIERALGVALARGNERPTDVALGGAGEADEALEGVRREPAALDARRAALLSFEVGAAHEAREIPVTGRRLTQQRHSRRRLPRLARLRDLQVDSDDRLETGLERRAIEFHHREEIPL